MGFFTSNARVSALTKIDRFVNYFYIRGQFTSYMKVCKVWRPIIFPKLQISI